MNLTKLATYVKGYTNYDICTKFVSSSIKNGLMNVKKKVKITNLIIVHISYEYDAVQ